MPFNYVNSPTGCNVIECFHCLNSNSADGTATQVRLRRFFVSEKKSNSLSANINKRFECFYWLLLWGSWFHAARKIKYSVVFFYENVWIRGIWGKTRNVNYLWKVFEDIKSGKLFKFLWDEVLWKWILWGMRFGMDLVSLFFKVQVQWIVANVQRNVMFYDIKPLQSEFVMIAKENLIYFDENLSFFFLYKKPEKPCHDGFDWLRLKNLCLNCSNIEH